MVVKVKNYLLERNWESFVFKRLNEVIHKHKNNPNAYAVFDFDNTSIIMDIEDNLMIYLLENLQYKLTPNALYNVLTDNFFKEDLSLPWSDSSEKVTGYNLAFDIVESYKWLYDAYITHPNKSELVLEEVKDSDNYKTFAAKLRYFHMYANTYLFRQPSKTWVTYLFAGYTLEEFETIARKSLRAAQKREYAHVIFESSPNLLGKAGLIKSEYKSGLSVPEELLELYRTLKEVGITTYIVSASPRALVQIAIKEFGYEINASQIIAMEVKTDKNNVLLPAMADEHYITREHGKTEVIKNVIMPKHNAHEPIAMFGDSIGDYDMMQTFTNADLNVIFNCHRTDEFVELVNLAVAQYNKEEAQFVLQGRDENAGKFIPSQKTISFGDKIARLYKEK